jgi:hypothetical protein
LSQKLRQLEQDSELLEEWAQKEDLKTAKLIALVLKNDVEQLGSDLTDFQTCFGMEDQKYY